MFDSLSNRYLFLSLISMAQSFNDSLALPWWSICSWQCFPSMNRLGVLILLHLLLKTFMMITVQWWWYFYMLHQTYKHTQHTTYNIQCTVMSMHLFSNTSTHPSFFIPLNSNANNSIHLDHHHLDTICSCLTYKVSIIFLTRVFHLPPSSVSYIFGLCERSPLLLLLTVFYLFIF